ncbi:hypothetical protein V8C26DRAFT_432667 [Trichoderma gracile]
MASGNSAQSGAHQQNVAFQFCFYQRNVYHITINTQTSSDSKRDDVNLRIRAYEQIIHREASVLAKYARSLDSLINSQPLIDPEFPNPYHTLLIAKRLLDMWEQKKKTNHVIDPLQAAKIHLYADRLKKLLVWLEAVIKLALGI